MLDEIKRTSTQMGKELIEAYNETLQTSKDDNNVMIKINKIVNKLSSVSFENKQDYIDMFDYVAKNTKVLFVIITYFRIG